MLLFLCLLCINSVFAGSLHKLSPKDTVELLSCIDKLVITDDTNKTECYNFYKTKVGKEFTKDDIEKIRNELHQLLFDHMNQKSWYSKMLGLISFSNILLLLLTLVVIAFIFTLFGKILVYCAAFIGVFIYELFFSKTAIYVYALIISYLTVYFRYELDIIGTKWESWYILDNYSVLVGLATLTYVITDFASHFRTGNSPYPLFLILSVIYSIIALYHNHWFVATLSIWSLYTACGFIAGPTFGGYYTGFRYKDQPQVAFLVSFALVTLFLLLKTNVIRTDYPEKVALFENGALFFGSFIGHLSFLIMTDRYYCKYYNMSDTYIVRQFLMVMLCLTTLYFGNVLNISTFNSIGGTFLVLWLLDIEFHICSDIFINNILIGLAIIGVNLYLFRYFILNFRDYFII